MAQESVLNMVTSRAQYGQRHPMAARGREERVVLNLFKDDYARLVQALKREDALRTTAYEIIKIRKAQGYRNDNSRVISLLEKALGQTLTQKDAVQQLQDLIAQGVSDDFFFARAQKLLARTNG